MKKLLISLALVLSACGQNASNTVYTTPILGNSAVYAGLDSKTQGAFSGVYGSAGYMLPFGASPLSNVVLSNDLLYNWGNTTAKQAIGGDATCFYSQTSFSFTVDFSDNKTHILSLYALDFDNYTGGRIETIQVTDGYSGAILSSNQLSSFQQGVYVSYVISGNVKVTVTNNKSAANAVLSGIFFN